MENVTDKELVADQIKKFYCEAKREQLGKPYRPAERYRNPEFWLRAAETCIEIGADPYSFVRGAFLFNSVPGGPFPQHMTSQAAVRWYNKYASMTMKTDGEDKITGFASEIQQLFKHVTSRYMSLRHPWTYEQFLLSTVVLSDHEIPAFVRCVMAPTCAEIWKAFGPQASVEMISNPQLPGTLRDLGVNDEVISHLLNNTFHG